MKDKTQKACALIINKLCGKVMRNRIKEKSNFEKAVPDKPVDPMKRIKECMCFPLKPNAKVKCHSKL